MDEMPGKKTVETRETEQQQGPTEVKRESVAVSETVDGGIIARRVVYYLTGAIVAILALRVVLLLLAANQGAPFVDFVYAVSGFFAWPFFGIFSYQPVYGQSVLEVSTVVAILVYALAGMGIARLFTLASSAHDEL